MSAVETVVKRACTSVERKASKMADWRADWRAEKTVGRMDSSKVVGTAAPTVALTAVPWVAESVVVMVGDLADW